MTIKIKGMFKRRTDENKVERSLQNKTKRKTTISTTSSDYRDIFERRYARSGPDVYENSNSRLSSNDESISDNEINSSSNSAFMKRDRRKINHRSQLSNVEDHSYIIKLLGRRINLTSFRVGVPLYPLCRAWIQDDPDFNSRSSRLNKNEDTPGWSFESESENDEPFEEELFEEEQKLCEGSTNDEIDETEVKALEAMCDEKLIKYDFPTAFTLPPHVPLPEGVITLRIPSPIPVQKNVSKLLDDEMTMGCSYSKEQLLKEHTERWKFIKAKWRMAAWKNQSRFHAAKRVLLHLGDLPEKQPQKLKNVKSVIVNSK